MPYKPQAPPLILVDGPPPDVDAGSPIPERPVTPVTAVTRLLSMTLSQFEMQGRNLEIKAGGLEKTIWFVPGVTGIERLAQRGIPHGRIWTAKDLRVLWEGGSEARENAISLARIKMAVDGEVVSVEDLRDPERQGEPAE